LRIFGILILSCSLWGTMALPSFANECQNWQTLHPEWIFCDDFEDGTPLVRQGRYFEMDNCGGLCGVADGVGLMVPRDLRGCGYRARRGRGLHLGLVETRAVTWIRESGIRGFQGGLLPNVP